MQAGGRTGEAAQAIARLLHPLSISAGEIPLLVP
jgi:hypothetical protein